MLKGNKDQLWASTVQGEILLRKLVKKPQKKCNIYVAGVMQAALLAAGIVYWYYGYIRILTGRLPEYLREWKVTIYLLGLWVITNLVLLAGSWFFKLLIWRRSEKFLRRGASVYRMELKRCPTCGGKLELYRKGRQLIFRCLGGEGCRYYIDEKKLLELWEED